MELSAIDRAAKLFHEHYPNRLFGEQLGLYLLNGYVINYPDLFVMFRPVERNAKRSYIIDPKFKFLKPDTFYIDLAVGKLSELLKLCPYPLRYFCFARKFHRQLKFYPADKLMRKVK